MIAGVGLPVNLELEAVTMGVVFKSGFILPMNSSDFWAILSQPFEPTSHPITVFNKRSTGEIDGDENGFDYDENEKFERHEVRAEVVENGVDGNENDVSDEDEDVSDLGNKYASTRWLVYKGLAEIAEQ